MDFTFGIITNDSSNTIPIIHSIKKLRIPNYEIIIVGGQPISSENVTHIPFDESIKQAWITKKKNIICNMAKYENIVLLHDYIIFSADWYTGFLAFSSNYDICITKIENHDGSRFRDYTIYPCGAENPFHSRALIPYNYPASEKLSKIMYISGSYYIIKKHVALQFPLDERLVWADGEDVLLIKHLVKCNKIIKCNPYSTVRFNKQKPAMPWEYELTAQEIQRFEKMTDSDIEKIHKAQLDELNRYVFSRTNIILDI